MKQSLYRQFNHLMWLWCVMMLLAISKPSTITTVQDTTKDNSKTSFVAFHPSGSMIAFAYRDYVDILDANNQAILNSLSVQRVQYASPQWSPDGTRLAIANNTNLEIWEHPWDSVSAHRLAIYPHDEAGRGTISAFGWSPNGKQIVSARGGYLKIWGVDTGQVLMTFGGDWEAETAISWSPSGDRFAVAYRGGGIAIWEAQTYNLLIEMVFEVSFDEDAHTLAPSPDAIAWSQDGEYLAVASEDWKLRIIDTTPTDRVLRVEDSSVVQILAHGKGVNGLAWRPGTQEVASASRDGTIKIWDVFTHQLKATFPLNEIPGFLWSIAWTPDGSQLVYGKPDQTLAITPISAPTNQYPQANAGSDQTVTVSSGTEAQIVLDGSASADTEGNIAAYWWHEDNVELADSAQPTVSLEMGIHILILTVRDKDGAIASDEVVITVNEAPATPTPTTQPPH